MIKKLNKNEDIIDVISGDIESIKDIVYYTHNMNKEGGIRPETNIVDDMIECRLSSQKIETLLSGQLVCEVELATGDSIFPDKFYNEVVKTTFPIWI